MVKACILFFLGTVVVLSALVFALYRAEQGQAADAMRVRQRRVQAEQAQHAACEARCRGQEWQCRALKYKAVLCE